MRTKRILILLSILLSVLFLSACGANIENSCNSSTCVLGSDTVNPYENGDNLGGDKSAPAVTLDGIAEAQKSVQSYHYIQNTEANGEKYTVEIFYKDNKMKTISTIDGVGEAITYFDFNSGEMISYIPSQGAQAMRMTIDANNEELPVNPLDIDYLNDYEISGEESYAGYECQILSSLDGSLKVWIMAEYGFPLKIEVTEGDFGVTYVTEYESISFNDLTDEDVSVPADLEIIDLNSMNITQ